MRNRSEGIVLEKFSAGRGRPLRAPGQGAVGGLYEGRGARASRWRRSGTSPTASTPSSAREPTGTRAAADAAVHDLGWKHALLPGRRPHQPGNRGPLSRPLRLLHAGCGRRHRPPSRSGRRGGAFWAAIANWWAASRSPASPSRSPSRRDRPFTPPPSICPPSAEAGEIYRHIAEQKAARQLRHRSFHGRNRFSANAARAAADSGGHRR